ncbi:MAG: hypothetical protein KF898_06500 [Parachlamydiales bacterium]|nr:hypothetical protein [Candidatus Acheromyda pituitae]
MSFKTTSQDHLPKNLISGYVCFESKDTSFVGKDVSYSFGKRIQLLNHEFLKISPHDLMYKVMTCTINSSGNEKYQYKFLPSSLFSQGRISTPNGDAICYTEIPDNDEDTPKSYLLRLAPTTNFPPTPFDEVVRTVAYSSKGLNTDFYSKADVPDDYCVIERSPGIFYSLSPETKWIEVGTGRVFPMDFDEVSFKKCSIHSGVNVFNETKDENRLTFEISACGEPDVEILFDRTHLYVTMQHQVFGNRIDFYHRVILKEPEMIDVDHISATFTDLGTLQITIPFFHNGNLRPQETHAPIFIASSEPVALPTEITVQYPARLGEHLYVRGEGSGFTWDQQIPLVNIDAHTWQLNQPMQGEFKFKILLNNEEWETGGDHPAKGGDAVAVTPIFASQAEKSAEASSLTRVSFFYQPAEGETLEIRDSLHDWSAGIELKDMGNGMWVWETDKAACEFDFKLVRRQGSGEIIWEGGDNRKMQPGQVDFIEPRF